MTGGRLIARSLAHHWRTNLAVACGVATAAAVLAGALVVGDSVRASLRQLALGRLGRTETVVRTAGFFRESASDDLRGSLPGAAAAPLVVAGGVVTHEASRRRAANVIVYGVDRRFWAFHGLPEADGVWLSPALASELDVHAGDALLARVQKPSQIPIESLYGRKEDIGRTIRLQASGTLPRERLGEFVLQPQQTEVRMMFVPLSRLQRDLGVPRLVNTVILAGVSNADGSLDDALRLEDLGIRVARIPEQDGIASTLVVDTESGIVNEAVERAVRGVSAARQLQVAPVFTYLANAIRKGDRVVPYSLVTATDLSSVVRDASPGKRDAGSGVRDAEVERPASKLPHRQEPEGKSPGPVPSRAAADGIVLNDWTARDLGAAPGDRVTLEYYLWDARAGLQSKTADFTVSAVVPIAGAAADRRYAPEYPGITEAESLADWDPPFPIDLSKVRPADEAYWHQYRTTPKAFVAYERGRELWSSRYGGATSLRLTGDAVSGESAASFGRELRSALPSAAMNVTITPARALALSASAGATDFGEYFTYFSFFIVVSALLLVGLFFKLGIEQRLREIGILRAAGFTITAIRRLLLIEATVLAILGGAVGAGGAVLYARFIMYGLRTWWVDAVGTTALDVHVASAPLLAGAAGGIVAAVICVFLSLRSVGRLTPRSLLQAQSLDLHRESRGRWRTALASLFAAAGLSLLVWGFASRASQTGAFFGSGAALLIAVLLAFSVWLRRRDRRPISGSGTWAIWRLGFRSASSRPGRSVLSAALIASATFLIFSIDAFRRGAESLSADPHSSSGGYVLLAQSELPLLHDPNTAAGRDALLIDGPELARTHIARFRLRPGQDASCLNLYRPTSPTVIAPAPGFTEANRFAFAQSLASTEAERANPWQLLERRFDDGAVPAVADATSLQYVLHARVGETFSMDVGADRPLVLRFVGALSDSVLQGELIIGESQFTRLFPAQQGYRFFLVEDPEVRTPQQAAALAGVFERELDEFGADAVGTAERLASFHRVENTYLSTFQALGGLGLVLGSFGVAAVMFRNVIERRRELALLRAVGYDGRRVSVLILAEAVLLLGSGLAAGAACAALAVAPAWLDRGGSRPGAGLAILLAVVAVSGLLSSFVATRAALGGPLLEALRAE
jgi:ABC-type lipoprotein release transport system permease subunit